MPDPFAAIDAAAPSLTPTPSLTTGEVKTPRQADPFEFIDSGGAPADRLTITTRAGLMQDSGRAARVLRLQQRTRMPADLLDRNLDEIEQDTRRADFDPEAFRAASPIVAGWLAEQPEHMAVAKDDLPRLAAIEQMVRESPDYAWDRDGQILGPVIRQGEGANRPVYRSTVDLYRHLREQQDLAIVDEIDQRERDKAVRERFGRVGGRLIAGAAQSLTATQRTMGTTDTSAESSQLAASAARNMPGMAGDIVSGVGGLTADLPLMLAGGALAPLARLKALTTGKRFADAAITTALTVQPLALREGITTAQDEGWANGLGAWAIETVIPAAFGTTGTEKVLASLAGRGVAQQAAPGLARAAGRLLLDAGLEGTEEAVTELAHALHEAGAGIDPDALNPDRLWPRLAVAGAVGAIAGGGFNLPGAIANASRRGMPLDREAQHVIQAASGQQLLASVMQAAAESGTVGTSPEAARSLFQSMLADKAPQVWIDREAWDEHFRSLNQDPRARAAELMGDEAKAYDEAARTGAPLRLDTGKLVVDVAKDKPTATWITNEARLDPAMMNAREAEDAIRALETQTDDPDAKIQQTAAESARAVQDDIEQQLVAAGFDAGSARYTAVQTSAVFRTMAARWNAGRAADDPNRTDARQLFLEWNVGINRPLPEVLTQPQRLTADQILAARRAKIADARLEKLDAERMAAQGAADQALAQAASGDIGFQVIMDATGVLEAAGGTMTVGDAMRTLGPAFGFRPDANAPITPEQAQRGNLLAAALRVRGKTLADLIQDAGAAKADPLATTATGQQPAVQDDPEMEKLAADGLRLRDLVAAIQAGRGDLVELEQAAALAAEVGPVLDRLPLDAERIADIRAAVEFAQDGRTLNQNREKRRGSITFGRQNGQRQTDIRLFEHADLSTVLHESGHLYLELLIDLAGRDGAPADIKDDLATALAWMGVNDPAKIRTEHHEKWARGFEAYLLEGKAPSAEMRGPFARFAAWLAAIYQSVRNLAVELSPEVRGVMDRLLATQEEIEQASSLLRDDPLFADAQAAGMSEADFAAYQKAREESRRQAEDQLRTEAMAEITRERTAAWKELRAQVLQEVELETNRAKEYVAESILRRGALPGGVPLPEGMPAIKLDSKDLRRRIDNRLGTEAERKAGMKRLAMMHARAGGMSLDEAAPLLGFDSGDALLSAMLTLRPRKELIEAETDQRMRARFGDILTDGSIAEKAMAALHNERKANVHLAEVRALATKTGKKVAPIEVLREAARRRVAGMAVRDLVPQVHLRAEMKARRALERALAKQDFDAAWIAKQQELLAHETYRAAVAAKADAEKAVEHLKKFTEKATRERIGKAGGWEWTVTKSDGTTETFPTEDEARTRAQAVAGSRFERTSGYIEQIDALLERYELRRVAGRQLARQVNLAAWVAQQQAAGIPITLPPEILSRTQVRNWRVVPVQELLGLRDAVANIAHMAGLKNKLSKAQREAELDATAQRLAATAARTRPVLKTRKIGEKAGFLPRLLALHRKAANVARQLDGDEDGGAWWDALIRPINEAGNAEAAMLREADRKQAAIWNTWGKATANDGWPAGERRQFAGFDGGLTRINAIMVALNWGNEGNRQRLLEGGSGAKTYDRNGKVINRPLTEAQVQAVLDSLTAADWDLVEAVWDHIDSYWSEIAALEQRTTGVAPTKVQPSPFPTRHGTIRGGYFPIIYDGDETGRIDGEATDLAKQIQAQAHGRTQTARGHTKERTIGQGRRLDLDPAAIGKHLTRVAHDLTHREAVADALRIILHPTIRAALDTRMGPATTRELRQWVADIASGPPTTTGARLVGFLRRGFSMATMGFRTMTAAIQLTGFANAAGRVGPARMAAAIGTLFAEKGDGRAWSFVTERSAMMRERTRTQTRELTETLGGLQGRGGGALETAERWQANTSRYAYWMMQQVQGVVDRATWLAAYDKAQDEGRSEDDSVAIADQAVLDTQGGGQVKDLSGVQRDAFLQVFTGAYTYGAMLFNQLYDQAGRIRRNPKDFGTWASATGNMMLITALPAAMAVILRGLTRDWWDDKEDKDPFAQRAAVEWGSGIMGSMIGVRELSGMLSGFSYGGPAVTRPLGEIANLGAQVGQGEIDAGLGRAVSNAIGYGLGLPTGQAWATGSGIIEWLDHPSADLRPIIFGPSPGH